VFYKPGYQETLFSLLQGHAAILRMLFAGHTHFDDFKVLDLGQGMRLGVHLTPSIGPNHGNDPSFQVGLINRPEGGLMDLATYTLHNLTSSARDGVAADWGLEYGFNQAYGQPFSTPGLARVIQAIRSGGPARALYETYFACQTPSQAALTGDLWKPYSCAQSSLSPEAFMDCACGKGP
jgi:hypothetical protein